MKYKFIITATIFYLLSLHANSQQRFNGFNDIRPAVERKPKDNISKKEYTITFAGFSDTELNKVKKHSKIVVGDNTDTEKTLEAVMASNSLSTVTTANNENKKIVSCKLTGVLNPLPNGKSAVVRFSTSAAEQPAIFTITFKEETADGGEDEAAAGIAIQDLVELVKLQVTPLQMPADPDCLTPDRPNPRDANNLNRNRIIYLADRNLTLYYDNASKLYLIGNPKKDHLKDYKFDGTNLVEQGDTNIASKRLITVKANQPLSFEVINVNPQAFDVEITDTAIRFNVESNALLSLLDRGQELAKDNQLNALEGYAPDDTDRVRVAMYLYAKELNELFLLLQNYCLYKQNDLVYFKIEAKKTIDKFFTTSLKKPAGQSMASFLAQAPGESKEADALLIKAFLLNYNALPSAYYKYMAQLPEVDGSYDKIAFTFSVKKKDKTPYMSPVSGKTINAWIKGGFKVDVSAGLYFAGLQDEHYSVRSDSTIVKSSNETDSVINKRSSLFREDKGKGEFGFASFLHFYPKISPGFNISLNIGAGVTFTETTRIRYLGGIGFLIGKENRLAVNLGCIMGNVNKLSSQYVKEGDTFKALSYAEAGKELVYTPKFSAQPFVSLTYNIPFIRKKDSGTQQVTVDDKPAAPAEQGKK